jgi:hypothetical protein
VSATIGADQVGANGRASPQSASGPQAGDGRSRSGEAVKAPFGGPGVAGPAVAGVTIGGPMIGGFGQDASLPLAQTETLTISASDPAFLRAPDAVRLEAYRATLGNRTWVGQLDQMRESVGGDVKVAHKIVGSTVAVSGAMSVGYVIWLLRGGLLLTSLLSSLPAWSVIDPMPVLARSGNSDEDGEDDDPLEKLFGRAKAAVGLGPSPAESGTAESDPVPAPKTVAEPGAVAVAPA